MIYYHVKRAKRIPWCITLLNGFNNNITRRFFEGLGHLRDQEFLLKFCLTSKNKSNHYNLIEVLKKVECSIPLTKRRKKDSRFFATGRKIQFLYSFEEKHHINGCYWRRKQYFIALSFSTAAHTSSTKSNVLLSILLFNCLF